MKLFPVITLISSISIIIAGLLFPPTAFADEKASDEYIKVEVRGMLNNEVMAIGGESTGVVITANGVTWELDFANAPALRKTSKPMNGQVVVVKGQLQVKAGIEIRKRWILKVKTIQLGNSGGDLSLLDIKSDKVKKFEVSQTFGGFRETQIFYTFEEKKVILKVKIDNKNKNFDVSAKIYVFEKSTTANGLGKWLNNQHSDGLYPDIPRPVSTLDVPAKFCSSKNSKFIDKKETHLGNFDNYSIQFNIADSEQIGDFKINAFSEKAMVHLKIK